MKALNLNDLYMPEKQRVTVYTRDEVTGRGTLSTLVGC